MAAPELCRIYGTIYNLDGKPNEEVQVIAVPDPSPTDEDQGGQLIGDVGMTTTPIEVFTNVKGAFELKLFRGARVRLEIPSINLRKVVTVPNQDEISFDQLI